MNSRTAKWEDPGLAVPLKHGGPGKIRLTEEDKVLCRVLGLRQAALPGLIGKLTLANDGRLMTLKSWLQVQVRNLAVRYEHPQLLVASAEQRRI